MNGPRTIALAASALLLTTASVRAQPGMTSQSGFSELGSEASITGSPSTAGEHSGIKLSESSMLHLGISASAGYDSNVFYNDQNKISAPILAVTPSLAITNRTR